MNNLKLWLIVKGLFILILSFSLRYYAPADQTRLQIRVAMIVVFAILFLRDLYRYSKKK